jgi:hypothetical protein
MEIPEEYVADVRISTDTGLMLKKLSSGVLQLLGNPRHGQGL